MIAELTRVGVRIAVEGVYAHAAAEGLERRSQRAVPERGLEGAANVEPEKHGLAYHLDDLVRDR